jgi:hypothetical protein
MARLSRAVTREPADDYSLDWWFRCVDDASVLARP